MPDEITCDVPGPSSNQADSQGWSCIWPFFVDCAGPLFSSEGSRPKFNYAFVAVDSFSRFPFCVPLKNLTAKSVCDALLSLWQFTGCCSYVSSDLGTNFTSQLTKEFERRMGCSPRFNSPYHPSSTGLAERAVGNVKAIIGKLAIEHPRDWHNQSINQSIWRIFIAPLKIKFHKMDKSVLKCHIHIHTGSKSYSCRHSLVITVWCGILVIRVFWSVMFIFTLVQSRTHVDTLVITMWCGIRLIRVFWSVM